MLIPTSLQLVLDDASFTIAIMRKDSDQLTYFKQIKLVYEHSTFSVEKINMKPDVVTRKIVI